tara:strand:+ start:1036 stop:1440 length:405 start_codon:yes stop_codon:yes gene_type:complete
MALALPETVRTLEQPTTWFEQNDVVKTRERRESRILDALHLGVYVQTFAQSFIQGQAAKQGTPISFDDAVLQMNLQGFAHSLLSLVRLDYKYRVTAPDTPLEKQVEDMATRPLLHYALGMAVSGAGYMAGYHLT